MSRGNLVSGEMDAWELKLCVKSGLYEGKKGCVESNFVWRAKRSTVVIAVVIIILIVLIQVFVRMFNSH